MVLIIARGRFRDGQRRPGEEIGLCLTLIWKLSSSSKQLDVFSIPLFWKCWQERLWIRICSTSQSFPFHCQCHCTQHQKWQRHRHYCPKCRQRGVDFTDSQINFQISSLVNLPAVPWFWFWYCPGYFLIKMRRYNWFRVQLVQTIILESSHIYTTIVVGRFTIGQRGIACCSYTTGTAPAALHSVTDCEQLASLLSIWQFPTTSPPHHPLPV